MKRPAAAIFVARASAAVNLRLWTWRILITLLALLAATSLPAALQHPTNERGFQAATAFQVGEIDHVNLFNGNLVIALPIGRSYPVGGDFSYQLTLTYNSKVWDWSTFCPINGELCYSRAEPNADANAGLGWQLTLGELIPPAAAGGFPRNDTQRWMYLGADGAEHLFYPTLHEGEIPTAGVFYSRDGSYLRLKTGSRTVESPDGVIHSFDSLGRLIRTEDRFGNYLAVSYGTNQWTLSDRHGRQQEISFRSEVMGESTRQVVDEVRLRNFNSAGGWARWKLHYGQGVVEMPFPHDVPTVAIPNPQTFTFLTGVTLPDGSQYSMPVTDYHLDGSAHNRAPGVIKRLRLPTLGYLAWEWGGYQHAPDVEPDPQQPPPAPKFLTASLGVRARRLLNPNGTLHGEWTYDPKLSLPATFPVQKPVEMTQRVVDPLGHATTHYFSVYQTGQAVNPAARIQHYGLPFTVEQTSGGRYLSRVVRDASGQLKRSVYVRYAWDTPGSNDGHGSLWNLNRRANAQETVYHDDGDRRATVTWSDFDGLGHYRQATTGGDFPSGNQRITFTNYQPGQSYPGSFTPPAAGTAWVLHTFGESWQEEAGVRAVRQACFDLATGFLLRERILKQGSAARHANDVLITYQRDGLGNRTEERYYGGDVQTLSTAADLCAFATPAVETYRLSHRYSFGTLNKSYYRDAEQKTFVRLVNRDIDRWTGLVKVSRDDAGLATSYDYDNLGRLTSIEPDSGHDARTRITYLRATTTSSLAQVEVERLANNGQGNALTHEKTRFDGFGRVSREERLLPAAGWAKRDTQWNALGSKTRVSEWYASAPTHWADFLDYDPFGRPGILRPLDGASHDVELTYKGEHEIRRATKVGTTAGSETNVATVERYDRQGRLYEVIDPGDNAAQATYFYDVGNRVVRARLLKSGQSQNRYLTYDQRGFLLSESHPESGLVQYEEYDARGQVGRRKDGASDLRYHYDRAERLIKIREASNPAVVWKEFVYATGNVGADLRKGKLQQAIRHNRLNLPWDPPSIADVAVTETYSYAGKGGRASKRDIALSTGQTFTQRWTWDELGNVAIRTYPRCTHAACSGQSTSGPARTVSFIHERGLLRQISGYTGLLGYHVNGMVTSIPRTNGVTDAIDVDPFGLPRPRDIRINIPSLAELSLGVHAYDGAGNVVQRGGESYTYDEVSRLRRYELGNGHWQSYGYDPFGNLKQIVHFNGVGETTRTINVSASNNHLTAATYDAAGRVLSWGGHAYAWDPMGMMKHLDFPDEVHIYTADDERVCTLHWNQASQAITEDWSLRDLGGKVLTLYETDGGNGGVWRWTKDYVYRDGLLAAADTPEAWPRNRQHFTVDHLGTPRLVTGADGAYLADHHYFGFGEEDGAGAADPEKMRFTGHERDFYGAGSVDDLDYMHARYYVPHLGRFLTVDPASFAFFQPEEAQQIQNFLSKPQHWNRYAYALSNPLFYTDPDGQAAELAFGGLMELAGGSAGSTAAGSSVAGPLILATGAGVSLGVIVNQIPGVSEALTFDALSSGVESILSPILMAENNRQTVKVINGLLNIAVAHVQKISDAGGPEKDPDFDHHKKEIEAFLKRISKLIDRLPKKQGKALLERTKKIADDVGAAL